MAVPSSIAWLDSSPDEQQRIRDLLNLFSESESRDELGTGQIRDAFSDSLLPGTSTLHRRARYLLFVPWCFRAAEHKGLSGTALAARVDANERRLLKTLKDSGFTDGLVGSRVGPAVKTLPSTIYWGALGQYRIRLTEASASSLAARVLPRRGDEPEELVERGDGPWCATLPPVPPGFPDVVEGGFDLTGPEARWLRERMLEGCPGSLLEHLLSSGHRPSPDSATPWDDPATEDAPGSVQEQLRNAELFSRAMHGAALLYNLLVAERYEAAGLTTVNAPVDRYQGALHAWAAQLGDMTGWDRQGMWDHVIGQNGRIAANPTLRRFVDTWLDAVQSGHASSAADDAELRTLVGAREHHVPKRRAQSRLVNDKLLRTWSGKSGSARLAYRWAQVAWLTDIHDGIEDDAGAPA